MSRRSKVMMLNWREEHLPLIEDMAKNDCDIVYLGWTGKTDGGSIAELKTQFPGLIVHLYKDISRAIPASGIDQRQIAPPGKRLLNDLSRCESEVMTMMTRLDYSSHGMPIHERKNLYYEMVRYWNGVIEMFQPDWIIHSVIPHYGGSDYVLYRIGELRQIKQLFLCYTFIGARSLVIDSIEEGCEALKRDIKNKKYQNIDLNELSEDLRNEYLKQTDATLDATPGFMKEMIKTQAREKQVSKLQKPFIFLRNSLDVLHLKPELGSFHDLSRREYLLNGIRWRIHLGKLKREYHRFAKSPQLTKPYVYFPLQYQPEASSSPQGDVFVDQLMVARILSYCLPEEWEVYVKEHAVAQWGTRRGSYLMRPLGYYQAIAQLPNVKIVPTEISPYDLISNAKAIATCTGTAAWESVCRGVPALSFGYPWFMDCPGIFRVQDVDSCKNILSSIAGGRINIDQQEIINFLYAFEKHSINGALYHDKLPGTGVTEEESRMAIINALSDKLK